MLAGRNPIYRHHVKEYTKGEVEGLLGRYGFRVKRTFYSEVNDLTFLKPRDGRELERLPRIKGHLDMLRFAAGNLSFHNLARAAAYPLVKAVPSLRVLIVAVAVKESEAKAPEAVERWG